MTNKNKVDDYYSNLSLDEKDSSSSVPKKPKIVKKVVVKKATPKVQKETDAKKASTTTKKVIRKKTIQKIEVVADESKKTWTKRPTQRVLPKKPANAKSSPKIQVIKKEDIVRKTEPKIKERTPVKKTYKSTQKPEQTKKDFTSEERKKRNKSFGQMQKTRWRIRFPDEDFTFTRAKVQNVGKKQEKKVEDIKQNLVEKKWETIIVWDFISIKELSEKTWVILPKIIAEFMKNWMMVNINSKIDFDSASIIAEAFEVKLKKDDSSWASVEDIMIWDISSFLDEDDQADLSPRPPVVSIMWHVDHWKTSLLDYIRKSKVASGEAWWITQSIWAYQVELDSGKITFLDTPGHEAFTIMRARWAKSTDIAILVVAADEWVKPQTIESISHAKEASIPVVVAINKMDKQWANPDHVKWQLAEHGLTPEDWGWDTPMVPVSAHSWFWIDELLEIIILTAEMKELKANPNRNAVATVIESHLNSSLWPVATVLINTWTIQSGDNIVCADAYWKVKILKNYNSEKVKYAKSGDPVLIVWLDKVVEWWDILQVVNTPEIAKNKVMEYKIILEKQKKESSSGLELLMSRIKSGNLKQLKIILKADTNGSLEAIKWSLLKLSTPETSVSIIHSWVGKITEWDILMWQGSQAILIWFNTSVLSTAKSTLESSGVEFISSDIIYHITEKIEKIITGMLDPKEVEVVLWRAKVGQIFFTQKKFMIIGLQVQPDNKIEVASKIRVFRNKKYIWAWEVDSLKQWTLDVKEVEGPIECGIKFVWNVKLEEKDELEFYKIEIEK